MKLKLLFTIFGWGILIVQIIILVWVALITFKWGMGVSAERLLSTPTEKTTAQPTTSSLGTPELASIDTPVIQPTSSVTSRPIPSPTIVSTRKPPIVHGPEELYICSPLKDVKIENLHAIISDGYHPPPPGQDGRHFGVDFSYFSSIAGHEILGTEIDAILPGRVSAVVFNKPPFGNMVIIETGLQDLSATAAAMLHITAEKSLYHLYAHMEQAPSVDVGYTISCGQFLGRVGNTGNSGNPHLHLETRRGPPGMLLLSLGYDVSADKHYNINKKEEDTYFLWSISGTFEPFDAMTLFGKSSQN